MAQVAIRRVEKYFGTTRVIHGAPTSMWPTANSRCW